jgi:AraC family transcriptional regulator
VEWVRSLNNAIEYIEENLCQEFTCADVANSVFLSGFHFQRVFSRMTGLTVSEYVRNRRISLAGAELQARESKVIDVAMKYCYETPESFAKAFKRFHGVTPMQAKRKGVPLKYFARLTIKIVMEGGDVMNYRIVDKGIFTVVAKTREFVDETSAIEIPKFWNEYFAKGYHKKVCGAIGICCAAEEGKSSWKYGIGAEDTPKFVKDIPEGFEKIQVPAYTWAIFTCVGAMPDAIQNTWKRIYSEWLPQAEYEMIQDYDIEYYTEGNTQSPDYVSEIWIPVRKKSQM